MLPAISPALVSPADRRRWLRGLTDGAKVDTRRASLFTTLDVVGAVAFAAGLALILDPIARGALGPLPGMALALTGVTARAGFARLAAGAGGRAAARIKTDLRSRTVRGFLGMRHGERRPLGETLAVAADMIEAIDGYAARFAPAQAAAAAAPLLVAAVMALASPISAAVVMLTFIPFIAGMALAGGAAEREAGRQFEALAKLSGLFADRIRQLPLLLAFQAEADSTQRLSVAADALAQRTLRVVRVAFLSSAVLEFFAALSVALVAVYCGFNLLHLLPFPAPEHLDLRRAVFVLALAPEAYLPMRRLAAAYHDRQTAEAAAEALATAARTAPPPPRRSLGRPPRIQLVDVTVIYPDSGGPALSHFALNLTAGESVALMGPTGSGKSTVLNLLLGLTRPSFGEVLIDGAPVDEGAPLAAYAGQAPMVIPGSLRDNIALARRDAPLEEVVDAARRAGLLNTPGGLERRIDERGGGLSGGERRRLGLARAFLSHAPMLLLDEPSANLDALSEALLLPVIAEAMRGRTCLIATHSRQVAALAERTVRLGR